MYYLSVAVIKMNSEFTFRLYDGSSKDIQIVHELELACPQGTDVQMVYAAREPRATKFGNDFVIMIAESKETGQPMGLNMATWRRVQLEPGNFIKVSWMFGLRILPQARRSGLATKLVNEMEKWMVENEINFVYCGIFENNVPSLRLFKKLGYNLLFETEWININAASLYPQIKSKPLPKGVVARKLNPLESGTFVQKHFGSRFFFPDWSANPLRCDVVEAKNSDGDSVAFVVSRKPEGFVIAKAPGYVRFVIFVYRCLSWLLPSFFERPLPLDNKAWRSLFILPLLFQCKNEQNIPMLTNVAMETTIKEYAGQSDLLVTSLDYSVSGIQFQNKELAQRTRKMLMPSKIYPNNGGIFFGKCIGITDPTQLLRMTRFIEQQKHWFMDGNEI